MKKNLTPIQEQIEALQIILKHGYNKEVWKQLGFIAEQHQKRLRQIKGDAEGNTDKSND